jgi:7tm Odorant receptor
MSDWGKGWKFKAWEIITLISALICLYLIMKVLTSTMVNFRVASMCQPVITLLVYIPVLAKNIYLLIKKNSLLELFKTMEEIIAFHPFKNRQERIISAICKKTRKTLLLLTFICTACYLITLVVFGRFDASIRIKLVGNGSALLTDDERVTSEIIRAGTWTKDDYAVLSINAIYAGVLPVKNILMDCFMFLCHNFVVQELNLLQQTFSELDAKKIAFVNKSGATSEHDQWIAMFHKIRKYVCRCHY